MATSYATATNNARLNAIAALVDAGASGGLILIQDGTRPATGGALTTTLVALTMSTTAFSTAANGVMTANAITENPTAAVGGTATWFRITDSDGNFVMDGDVGTDLVLSPNSVVTVGEPVSVSSFVITAGNA